MNNEKPIQVDEKTGKLIEEMEKSLHNMEQSLGPDHAVIAKILDSYAQLLRQNNLRPLDALNMEARARAIRAKHNQREAEKQERGLESSKYQKSSISTNKMRLLVWSISVLICFSLAAGLMQLFKWSAQKKAVKSTIGLREPERESAPVTGQDAESPASENSAGTDNSSTAAESASEVGQAEKSDLEQAKKLTVLEYAGEMLKLKRLAKEQLAIGQEAEKEKDFPKAGQAYESVIKAVENNGIGKIPVCEEIAACYEGYGRMAELDAHPEITAQCAERAREIRAMMNNK